MKKETTQPTLESSPTGEDLETWWRNKMRGWLQERLDAEVDERLGRRKSARRQAVESATGYRSGHGKPRRLTLCHGTVTIRRPRGHRVAARAGPCTGSRWATAISPCAGLLGEDAPPCRRPPWRVCRRSGRSGRVGP